MSAESESYLAAQNARAFKIGEAVTCTRTAEADEQGWSNSWPTDMDRYIGATGRIIAINGASGICVVWPISSSCSFPHFVLERVNPADEPGYESRPLW